MRTFLTILALLVAPAASYAGTCASLPPRLAVDVVAPKERVDRTRSSRELSSMLTDSSLPGYVTQGLTKVDYSASYTSGYRASQRPDGTWCSNVEDITITFGFKTPPTIYIANGLEEGSCVYREVVKHEYQHLAIAHSTLDAGRKWISKAVSDELAKGGEAGISATAANEALENRIRTTVNRITGGLYQTARLKNLALDTPENYARLSRICRQR